MLVGNQVKEVAKKQKKELKGVRKNLEKEAQKAAEIQMKLQEEEAALAREEELFGSVQDELDFKTEKLERLWE